MRANAVLKSARISAFKCREVTREIQGLSVANAFDVLDSTPRKAARLIEKVLKSAVANAEHNASLRAESLVVELAVVNVFTPSNEYLYAVIAEPPVFDCVNAIDAC